MPSTNQCIGSHYDELKQRVFYFNYNSAGYNGIYVYDMKTNAIAPLLISYVDSAEDLFGFDPKYPIASANILYRTEEDGDILLWTDRLNRPMKINIKDATVSGKTYGSSWKKSYLTVARPMPLISPLCTYYNDTNVAINNLRSKLYMFRYRWVYKDNTKSTWGPWSKLFAPANVDTLTDDINQTKSNRIDITVKTGAEDCVKIEIGARHNIGSAWTDTMLIATLDKSALGIVNNGIYVHKFYNDKSYNYIDQTEESLLFDYTPKTANAQELLNGNIIAYAGIKEGNTFSQTLNISKTLDSIANPSSVALTINQSNKEYIYNSCSSKRNGILFTFSGANLNGIGTVTINGSYIIHYTSPYPADVSKTISATYTNSGGTIAAMITDLAGQINSGADRGFRALTSSDSCNSVPASSIFLYPTEGTLSNVVNGSYSTTGASGAITEVSNACYKSGARYGFGLVYFDEYGVTNGVVTNDTLSVLTPESVNATIGDAASTIPSISFTINHQPPSWAKTYSFVRTENLSLSSFRCIASSASVKKDDQSAYLYISIHAHQVNTSKIPIYEFQTGDRVRIMGIKGGTSAPKDLPISALVYGKLDTPWLGQVDATVGTNNWYLKVPYDSSLSSYIDNALFLETYTPNKYIAGGNSSQDSNIYYEFGETYAVSTDINGNLVHNGQLQNQILGTNSNVTPPASAPTLGFPLPVESGNLGTGTYSYRYTYVTESGESNPGPVANIVTVSGSTKVIVSFLSVPAGLVSRKIYRTEVNGSVFKLLATLTDNSTSYTDNTADASLGAVMPQPASFNFIRGDFYQKGRTNPVNNGGLYVIDKSASDKFDSEINGNGRAFVIDAYAKETYFPTVIRYSLDYQQNTNINNTNRFRPENLDEYDRERGDIQRLVTRGRQLRVFQNRGCGMAPIYQNVMQTADGTDVISQNSAVLNKIQYYQGEFGLGDQYCSLASSAQADYFTDPVIGAQVRLSADGLTSLTEIYKAHYYFNDKLTKYQKKTSGGNPLPDKFGNGGYAKILGVYDVFEEQFTTCMQGSADSTNPITEMTFAFSESRNCYVSFYDYYPEWICNAGNLIITWKNGELWTHNNTTAYSNFFGTQYSPSIKLVFNDHQNIKKHFNTITTLGNTTWVAETQGDINTNLGQQSKLIQADFKVKDDKYHASFKRDALSPGGLYNGNVLKGTWLEMNLKPVNPQNLVDLYYIELSILQPLNNR